MKQELFTTFTTLATVFWGRILKYQKTSEEQIAAWNTRTDPLLEKMAEALERVSEDGHALLSMTIGSRIAVLEDLQEYRDHVGQHIKKQSGEMG